MHITTVTHQWQWPMKFALEGTVASEVGILGLSHIAISRSCIDCGPGQALGPAHPLQVFCTYDAISL
jgi:hypothetical protein